MDNFLSKIKEEIWLLVISVILNSLIWYVSIYLMKIEFYNSAPSIITIGVSVLFGCFNMLVFMMGITYYETDIEEGEMYGFTIVAWIICCCTAYFAYVSGWEIRTLLWCDLIASILLGLAAGHYLKEESQKEKQKNNQDSVSSSEKK